METLDEQLKAAGFAWAVPTTHRRYVRNMQDGWELVQFIGGRVSVAVCVLSVGDTSRWFPATVTIEEIEAFITRARRVIAEWDTCEISFTAPILS
jgi:Flp pilus assembly CpaF family ATPase